MEKGPELWILRMAVLSRAQTYLQHLEDLQQRLAQNLEVIPPEYPHPSIHRRREQGVYTQYLAHRVVHLRTEMDNLLQHLGNDSANKTPKALILHRWAHGFSSRQGIHIDESLSDEANSIFKGSRNNVEFVQTGYWMLDRQENQSIISHEVAHHALRQHYDNLQVQYLAKASSNDVFADLMRQLIFALKSFSVPYESDVWSGAASLIDPKEIACDLLAGSTKANSYLFAFLLEVVGRGLEYTMVDQHRYQPHLSVNFRSSKRFYCFTYKGS